MTDILIQPEDLEELRFLLKANLTWLQAQDLAKAQIDLSASRPSALTEETERIAKKFDFYYSQYLIDKHEEELYGPSLDVKEDAEEAPAGSQGLTEGDLEELSDQPLGQFERPKQKGRRVTAQELTEREAAEEE